MFFVGILFIAVIDMLIPEERNTHHYTDIPDGSKGQADEQLMHVGLFTAFAIAIHNIPEDISVSVPLFYATHDLKKAFRYSFLVGLAEPVGTVIGFAILLPFLSTTLLISLLAFVAGIMVYISIDELLPMAHRYGHSHIVILGVIIGMFLMALSLFVL